MEHEVWIGRHVIFVDADRTRLDALVTQVWPGPIEGGQPTLNLALVKRDATAVGPCGRLVESVTSVVHLSVRGSGDWCWCYPEEVSDALPR